MNIGVVGYGVIGKALASAFAKHDIFIHDLKLNTNLIDLLKTKIIFICVSTPSNEDGSCDTSAVEETILNLVNLKYDGIIAIKSTVEPGFTKRMLQKYDKIVFCPEFLREHRALEDFINYGTCIIGSNNSEISDFVAKLHNEFTNDFLFMDPTEAEMVKYYHNTFNALRVLFANEYYAICNSLDIDYNSVLEAFTKRNNNFPKDYLKCNESLQGYAGPCLPKDTRAINAFCKQNNLNLKLFEFMEEENKKFKRTVILGMREIDV